MEVKRYKHKPTGRIFTNTDLDNWYKREGSTIGIPSFPPDMVEGCCDWEEILPWRYTTEDGATVERGHRLCALYRSDLSPYNGNDIFADPLAYYQNVLLYFSSIEARDEYLAEHKKLFSARDIIEYTISQFGSVRLMSTDFKEWPSLKQLALKKNNSVII